jgi:hypothetical protein
VVGARMPVLVSKAALVKTRETGAKVVMVAIWAYQSRKPLTRPPQATSPN